MKKDLLLPLGLGLLTLSIISEAHDNHSAETQTRACLLNIQPPTVDFILANRHLQHEYNMGIIIPDEVFTPIFFHRDIASSTVGRFALDYPELGAIWAVWPAADSPQPLRLNDILYREDLQLQERLQITPVNMAEIAELLFAEEQDYALRLHPGKTELQYNTNTDVFRVSAYVNDAYGNVVRVWSAWIPLKLLETEDKVKDFETSTASSEA